MSDDEDALFPEPDRPVVDLPAATELRKPKKVKRPLVGYSRWRPMTARLCDDCVQLIHERGVDKVPPPRSARWRRHEAGTTRLLCTLHMDARKASEVRPCKPARLR